MTTLRPERAGQPRRRGVHPAVRAVLGDVGPARRQVREVAADPLDQAVRDRDHGRSAWPASGSADLALLFVALALMGVHSTLFGPVKYAILPQHLSKPEELIGGNGLVEMGTFVAILLGTIVGGLVVAIEPDGPVWAGALADRHRGRRLAREPRHPAHAGGRPGPADQLEPVHRDLEEPPLRAGQPRGLAVDARHLVVLVLRRDLPRAVRRTSRRDILGGDETRRDAAARAVLGRHRRRLAAVRAAVGAQGRARAGAVRLDRPDAVRHRPVVREPRPARAHGDRRAGAFLAEPRALARRRRPGADRPVRRLLHRAAVRADPGALSAPSHRSRIIAANNILNALFMVASARLAIGAAGGRAVDSRALPGHRR